MIPTRSHFIVSYIFFFYSLAVLCLVVYVKLTCVSWKTELSSWLLIFYTYMYTLLFLLHAFLLYILIFYIFIPYYTCIKQSFPINLVTVCRVPILKWAFDAYKFNFFKLRIILWLPSFLSLKICQKLFCCHYAWWLQELLLRAVSLSQQSHNNKVKVLHRS